MVTSRLLCVIDETACYVQEKLEEAEKTAKRHRDQCSELQEEVSGLRQVGFSQKCSKRIISVDHPVTNSRCRPFQMQMCRMISVNAKRAVS